MDYWTYLIIIIIITIIPQIMVTTTYQKYSKISLNNNKLGVNIVEEMLRSESVIDVSVRSIPGTLTDNYNPRNKIISLSRDNYNRPTIASVAVAAHETGHAIQDNKGYLFLRIRQWLGPITITASKFSWAAIYIGFLLFNKTLILFGIACVSITVLFSIITLPVEINASKRAKKYLALTGEYSSEELSGVNKVLTAAAFTYVAAALAGILQLIRLLAIIKDD